MRVLRAVVVLVALFALAGPAYAYDFKLGYRIGLAQSAGAALSDNQELIVVQQPGGGAMRVNSSSAAATRLQGLNFTTSLDGNLSFDLLTSVLDHALVLGAGFTQTVPAAVPDDANASRDRVSTLQASAQYIAVRQQPTYAFAFGGGYNFLSNGRLATPPNGATPTTAGPQPVPGQQFSSFLVSGQIHTLSAFGQAQLTRLRWDASLGASYTYTSNGIFNLAPGVPGQAGNTDQGTAVANALAPRITTNVGAFVRASTHSLAPSLTYRTRAGSRGLVLANILGAYTRPITGEPQTCERNGDDVTCVPSSEATNSSTTAFVVPAPAPIPETLNSFAALSYVYSLRPERSFGIEASAAFGMRIPVDPRTQLPSESAGLAKDTLINQLSLIYQDQLPWELRLDARAGVAQPFLFQPPLGATVQREEFDTVRGDFEPVFNVTMSRFFDPVSASLSVVRSVGVGALGASAIITEGASLTFAHQPRVFGRRGQLGVGFNVNLTHGVGADLVRANPVCDPATDPNCPLDAIAVSANNRGAGAQVTFSLPMFEAGSFTGLLAAQYTFAWFDPDPDGTLQRKAFTTHGALITITLALGRGPLAEFGPGSDENAELSAFSQDPATGSPLTSARLLRSGAPILDNNSGRKPGEPSADQRDSRRTYEQERTRQQSEQQRVGAEHGQQSIQEEQKAAEERDREEREAREKARTRKFSEWPMDAKALPTTETSTATPDESKRR